MAWQKQSIAFESSVNSEGIEAPLPYAQMLHLFESSVNSEGIEALRWNCSALYCLRAV